MRNVPEHTCQGRRHTATPSHGLSVAVTAGVASQDVTKAEVRDATLEPRIDTYPHPAADRLVAAVEDESRRRASQSEAPIEDSALKIA